MAPIVQCNLATAAGQEKFNKLNEELKFDVLHAAPPCGTASKARERALPLHLIRQGIPTPRQLRSNSCPLGLPGLSANEQLRVTLANKIYSFVLQKCIDRHKRGELFSLENPDTSYFFRVPLAIVLLSLPGVKSTVFAQCLHGGSRPVMRRWVSNIPGMEALEGGCPGVSVVHIHAAYGATKYEGTWKFATAEEATYPVQLCNKLAKIIAAALAAKGVVVKLDDLSQAQSQPIAKRLCNRAAGGKYVRGNRLPPIISEFRCTEIMQVPMVTVAGSTIPLERGFKGRVLRFTGERAGEPQFREAVVGIYRSPEQFVDQAWSIRHPIDLPSSLPEALIRNIFWLLTTSENDVREFRLKAIHDLRKKAAELDTDNQKIHLSLSTVNQKVLRGKHFKLMEWALHQAGYEDTTIVNSIITGTPLTGTVESSGVFPERYIPASLDRADLLKASPVTRKPILESIRSSGDKEIDTAVWTETMLECEKGWLSRPMTEQEIASELGSEFTIARRFGLQQGGKIRAIDDYSEHGTNATVTTKERIDLLGTDELFLVMKAIASSVQPDGKVSILLPTGERLNGNLPAGVTCASARTWLGKTYDLKSAYRQLATSEENGNRKVCVIGVHCPLDDKTYLFIQYGSPFGSVASVYYFNRAARAVWAIGLHYLRMAWTNYFDDYPTLCPHSSAGGCDITTKAMFAILGWELSLDPKKTKPFAQEFPVLGVVADLTQLPQCTAIYKNKSERVRDISEMIDKVVSCKICPQPLMAELRGKSQYAASQVFGRMAVGPLHVMANHQQTTRSGALDNSTITALLDIRTILNRTPPRTLSCLGDRRPLLLFTDGAAEGESRGNVTCGAVLIDTASDFAEMFGGRVPATIVKAWKADGHKIQVIGQAELLPVALARLQWREKFRHRRLIVFIDNDGARQSLIRGWSPSISSQAIIREMLLSEVEDQVWTWFARVPTHSNPADNPSRLILVPSAENDYATVIAMPIIPRSLFPRP